MTDAPSSPPRPDRRLRYPAIWLAFIATMCVGAALLTSPDPTAQNWGLVLLASPVLVFGVVAGAYYFLERARSS